MKINLLGILVLFMFCKTISAQTTFEGNRYSFQLIDEKNPGFSEMNLIKDLSSIEGVQKCTYNKETKEVALYSNSEVILPVIKKKLRNQWLSIKELKRSEFITKNLEALTNETK